MRNTLSLLSLLLAACLVPSACNKKSEPNPSTTLNIVNTGNGAVNSISDASDEEPLRVAQAIPATANSFFKTQKQVSPRLNLKRLSRPQKSGSSAVLRNDNTFASNIPVIFFFDDKILLSSVQGNVEIKQNNQLIGGTLSINESSNGFAVFTFIPVQPFSKNQAIEVILKKELQDDGGNEMDEDFVLNFNTNDLSAQGSFDNNKSFESELTGVLFQGDGAVFNAASGGVSAQNGSRYAVVTTGEALASGNGAISNASSLMILGPINTGNSVFDGFSFQYDFISSEFNEFVDSVFDDSAVVTVYGPKGAFSALLTSVNIVGIAGNQTCNDCVGLPDAGDAYAGHTNWTARTLNFTDVGTPAYIVFTVSDVSDTIYSSALLIDNVSY